MSSKHNHPILSSSSLPPITVQRLSIFDRQYPVRRANAPAAPMVLQHLPRVTPQDYECSASGHPKDCSICNESIETTAVRLPCSHIYHSHCIKQWLKDHDTCPLCRCSLPTLSHFTTPRAQLPPPPAQNAPLRPPTVRTSELQRRTLEELQDSYRSWVICTYHHQQLPINPPQNVSNDRAALISYMAECSAIRILPEETNSAMEQ